MRKKRKWKLWTRARTTTSPNPSACRNCWPAFAPRFRRTPLMSSGTTDLLNLGPTEINFVARRRYHRRRGSAVDSKEFDLLRYFASNPDVAIPHTKLLQPCGARIMAKRSSTCAFSLISFARKSNPTPRIPPIFSLSRGFGYRLNVPKA